MKAIVVLFDSLNRHYLSPYGCSRIQTPQFQRLAQHSVQFDRCYVGSMPCMPARRELHTGRCNFLHRSWGPLEPFDDSMPELLRQQGVYTHLISDHQHYWEDGGATYHTRYSSWECVRGQEGDPWKAQVQAPASYPHYGQASRQDTVNRAYFAAGHKQPLLQVFDLAQEFIETNHAADNWLLQIEPFDPHEPFFLAENAPPRQSDEPLFDWPPYERVSEPLGAVAQCRQHYEALLAQCDRCLGRVLDQMDIHNLWKDTMLIVTTDHGFLLGEHGWWAKNRPPFYEELSHIPLFIWDPRTQRQGERRQALVQTIDLAPTLLRFFGKNVPPDMQGHDLAPVLRQEQTVRAFALFGMFGAHACVTDGRYVYLRADRPGTALYDYTLLPLRQRSRCAPEELQNLTLHEPFSFTKGCRVLQIPMPKDYYPCMSVAAGENHDLLFDLKHDPQQARPLQDTAVEQRMIDALVRLMHENDAPPEQFVRLGLQQEIEEETT